MSGGRARRRVEKKKPKSITKLEGEKNDEEK